MESAVEPIFEVRSPSGKVFQIWANGQISGFEDGSGITNGIAPLLNYASGLLMEPVRQGMITKEQASHFLF